MTILKKYFNIFTSNKDFNLIRWFSFFGVIVIVFISITTSYILSEFLEKHLLTRDAIIMEEFMVRIAQHHNPGSYFSANSSPKESSLNDFFNDISHMPDVVRINAFDTKATIVWSSDKQLIGKSFPTNHELIESLNGEMVFEKGKLSQSRKDEHQAFREEVDWFVENYIPIKDKSSDLVVGVIEIYRIPRALSQSISQGRKLVWISISSGGVVLFFSLFGVIRKGQFLIEDQHDRLIKQTRLATTGELVSSVAHNIRNPIASIRSSAELAMEDDCNAHVSESLKDIMLEVDRLDSWLIELLTFTNKTGNPEASASLTEVIASSLDNFRERAERNVIELINQVPSSLPRIQGESELLAQVINSLLANSFDAMPNGGSIILAASLSKGRVIFLIEDNGYGIPPERMQGLFEPLVSHKSGGLGIGLALARQIIHRYKGNIFIKNSTAEGTIICIEFAIAAVTGNN